MSREKNQFSSKVGFVLAAAGSAVGLGNLWRFPYLAATYGGGIFLLVYLILVATFGFTLMITEIAIGRKTGHSVVNAYKMLNKKFSFWDIYCLRSYFYFSVLLCHWRLGNEIFFQLCGRAYDTNRPRRLFWQFYLQDW